MNLEAISRSLWDAIIAVSSAKVPVIVLLVDGRSDVYRICNSDKKTLLFGTPETIRKLLDVSTFTFV